MAVPWQCHDSPYVVFPEVFFFNENGPEIVISVAFAAEEAKRSIRTNWKVALKHSLLRVPVFNDLLSACMYDTYAPTMKDEICISRRTLH